jgi:hypothetical protein
MLPFFRLLGCWGVKVSQGRSTIVHAAEKLFHNNHFHEYDYDQELLDMFVWPIARNNMVSDINSNYIKVHSGHNKRVI